MAVVAEPLSSRVADVATREAFGIPPAADFRRCAFVGDFLSEIADVRDYRVVVLFDVDIDETLKNPAQPCGIFSDPAAIRTQDLLLRRQLLYPAELQGLFSVGAPRFELGISCSQSRRDNRASLCPDAIKKDASGRLSGGEGGIRTPGTLIEYDSLANCWFQPLTHLSVCSVSRLKSTVFCLSKTVQKYKHFLN